MPDTEISIDEYLSARKDFVRGGDVVVKAAKSPASWDDNTRSARFVMSSEAVDRDKDIVVQAGLDIAEFAKNPVGFFAHRQRDFPVGQWSDIEKVLKGRPARTEGTLTFLPEGGDKDADRAAFHVKHGFIKTCSIGFMPTKIKRREADGEEWPGYMIEASKLLECSVVPIPANPDAMAKAVQGNEEFVMARDVVEDILDNWAKHPETGLIVPRAEFETAYKTLTGDRTSVVTLTEGAETSLLTKFRDSVKSLFTPPKPEAKAPVLATDEAKAKAAARLEAYRQKALAAN